MRKGSLLLLVFILIGFGYADLAIGWPLCFKDTNYTSQYQVEVVNMIIRGQAYSESPSPNFPAPITGYVANGVAYFSIAYLNSTGLRFYYIQISSKSGETWGIDSIDSSFYDNPHSATLAACQMLDEEDLQGDSGAMD